MLPMYLVCSLAHCVHNLKVSHHCWLEIINPGLKQQPFVSCFAEFLSCSSYLNFLSIYHIANDKKKKKKKTTDYLPGPFFDGFAPPSAYLHVLMASIHPFIVSQCMSDRRASLDACDTIKLTHICLCLSCIRHFNTSKEYAIYMWQLQSMLHSHKL